MGRKKRTGVPANRRVVGDSLAVPTSVDLGLGEPTPSRGESPNALRLATPQGSLSIPDWDVPPRSDSPPCVCTPPSVPPPPCGAGQTNPTDSLPYVCTLPKVPSPPCDAVGLDFTKVARSNIDEKMNELLNETKNELLNETMNELLNETMNELLNETINERSGKTMHTTVNETLKTNISEIIYSSEEEERGSSAYDNTRDRVNANSFAAKSNDDPEVVFVMEAEPEMYTFRPISCDQGERLSHSFNLHLPEESDKIYGVPKDKLGKPKLTKSIEGDGNCFFRAVSFALTNSEGNHRRLRTQIVHHMLENQSLYLSHLRSGERSVSEYVLKKGMLRMGEWATEVEILAAADMLCTDIFIYEETWSTWLKFSSKQVRGGVNVEPGSIYLIHKYQAHYDVVLDVEQEDSLQNDISVQTFAGNKQEICILLPTKSTPCKTTSKEDDLGYEFRMQNDGQGNPNYVDQQLPSHICNDQSSPDTQHQVIDHDDFVKSVQGNFHQGDARFGLNAGNQCVANCLSASAYCKFHPVCNWTSHDLDNILYTGNDLYTYLQSSTTMQNDFLLIEELPRDIEIRNQLYHFDFQEPLVSVINMNVDRDLSTFNAVPLHNAISLSLKGTDCAFICFGGNAFLIGRIGTAFFIFDSHARSEVGLVDPFGKSVAILYPSLDALYRHVQSLSHSMQINTVEQVEITGVTVNIVSECEISNTQHNDIHVPDQGDNVEDSNISYESKVCKSETLANMDNEALVGISKEFEFTPELLSEMRGRQFTSNEQLELCSKFNVKKTTEVWHSEKSMSGTEVICHRIQNDGNSFFRAIAYLVCNSDRKHKHFRSEVCIHAIENESIFKPFLTDRYPSVHEYISVCKMDKVNTKVTEFEIIAAAHLLKCDIWIKNAEAWLRYSPRKIDKCCNMIKGSIFLVQGKNQHYNVVIGCKGDTENMSEKMSKIKQIKSRKRKLNTTCKQDINDDSKDSSKILESKKSKHEYWRNYQKRKRDDDLEYRERVNKKVKRYYGMNIEYKEKMKHSSIKKYRRNKQHREEMIKRSVRKYKRNDTFRESVKQASIEKYKADDKFRESVKQASIEKYKADDKFRESVKQASIDKYRTKEVFRNKVKNASVLKYKTDAYHRKIVIASNKLKYRLNARYRLRLKRLSSFRYKHDKTYRENMLLQRKMKYKQNINFRKSKQCASRRYQNEIIFRNPKKLQEKCKSVGMLREKARNVVQSNIVHHFKKLVANGPDYTCISCKRLLFQNQCVQFKKDAYSAKTLKSNAIALEIANQNSSEPSDMLKNWICKTCHRKILSGELPAEADINNLKVEPTPPILQNLNKLETHLIAIHMPFLKVTCLPRGAQNCIHGPVVCVPTDLSKTLVLPRSNETELLIKVKLKRKLSYKGHYEYMHVNTTKMYEALSYLLRENKWYENVKIDDTLMHGICMETSQGRHDNAQQEKNSLEYSADNSEMNSEQHSPQPSETIDEEANGVQYDTCLQPADIVQDVLDHSFNDIYNIAPGEGKNPVKLLQEEGNEAKCFPTLFPSGKNTFDEKRDKPLTLAKYFNIRLMNEDNRFAKDPDYIFYCQYLSELKQVIDKTQISLRKTNSYGDHLKTIKHSDQLRDMLHSDEAFRFMQPIRGTPAYWESAQKDLFAMLRQLGIPTWFCSFSAAEFRWKDLIEIIMRQINDKRPYENLSWQQKSEILKSNPVTVARMFDHRFHVFLREVILGPNKPIGKVKDYFYRVEFQQRGSPHVHCLFWIDDAPTLAKDGPKPVCEFIDKYVTCSLPSEHTDEILKETVCSVQTHSKFHSSTCKKKGTACRFNFPRPPSLNTFLCLTNQDDELENDKATEHQKEIPTMTKDKAKDILKMVWEGIESGKYASTNKLLNDSGISQSLYEEAHTVLSTKQTIILKRSPKEIWVNQYNPTLLKCWDANMDIQFVLDPFSCIVYIISYISKAEREMGLLLKQTKIEAEEGNQSAKETLKTMGSAFLRNREVGIQEAVYRICSLRMKECSRKVVFIPAGENPTRLSKPLSQIKHLANKSGNESEEEIWLTNVVDRYYVRPKTTEFEEMCLALFCSAFRVLSQSQIPKNVETHPTIFKLQKDKGYIQRRTRTDAAIIRYFRGNLQRNSEQFFQSLLQLYLPHWSLKQLKPTNFQLYQSFYENGYVRFKTEGDLIKVRDVVDHNKAQFVVNEGEIDAAIEKFEDIGEPEDAWALLCPETERERNECLAQREIPTFEEDVVVADLESSVQNKEDIIRIEQSRPKREEILPVLKSLNVVQSDVFYTITQWCLDYANKKKVQPFHMFITGGAGTGKSHLIKAIFYEASRILSKISTEPESQCLLLTAFTGTAAFNIGGCTLHHAFKLNKGLPLPYVPLKEQTLSTLHFQFKDLRILIIDEVSMVHKRLLYYVHERLVQIMQNKSQFGGVSVIAVGDFFQLPPVKQKKSERLYHEDPANPLDLWNELFTCVELQEIMRQGDDLPFAKALNTIRTRTKDQLLPSEVINILESCQVEGPDAALHVFATNDEVNRFNNEMLVKSNYEIIQLPAKDYKRDKTSGKLEKLISPSSKAHESLSSNLLLSKRAKVMLIRNIDVSDGLVNGVIGSVHEVITDNSNEVDCIGIQFDNPNVGRKCRKLQDGVHVVYIKRVEEEITRSHTVRHQFPLKLAWACTTHKVQGMTVDKIVVNLDKSFSAGQGYVALSRVTSKSGLYIDTANMQTLLKRLYADESVSENVAKMARWKFAPELTNPATDKEIALLNIRCLTKNIEHLKADKRLNNARMICVTETWLKDNSVETSFQIDGYTFFHRTRAQSYSDHEKQLARGGGVGIFIKASESAHALSLPIQDIEGMMLSITDMTLILLYRPPSYPAIEFITNLDKLLDVLLVRQLKDVVLMGDFNENSAQGKGQIETLLNQYGFCQRISSPTTENGTVIDHVYTKHILSTCRVIPTYYSDHFAVILSPM